MKQLKVIVNILILIVLLVDLMLISKQTSEYVKINNKYDSIQIELNNFDKFKYKQFIIYCNLIDTLFNYHHNSVSSSDLIDFFQYNNESYLNMMNEFEYYVEGTKIKFSYRNSQLVCVFPLYYQLDSIKNTEIVLKKDILFYLENKDIK